MKNTLVLAILIFTSQMSFAQRPSTQNNDAQVQFDSETDTGETVIIQNPRYVFPDGREAHFLIDGRFDYKFGSRGAFWGFGGGFCQFYDKDRFDYGHISQTQLMSHGLFVIAVGKVNDFYDRSNYESTEAEFNVLYTVTCYKRKPKKSHLGRDIGEFFEFFNIF